MNRLGLIGFSGCGKSSLLNLAKAEGFRTVDTDIVIQKSRNISNLILDGRDSEFRELERTVIQDALAADNDVIAFGGGVHTRHIAWQSIKNADIMIIFLQQTFEKCVERAPDRPLMKKLGIKEFKKLFLNRQEMYREAAQKIISVNDMSLNEIWIEVRSTWS